MGRWYSRGHAHKRQLRFQVRKQRVTHWAAAQCEALACRSFLRELGAEATQITLEGDSTAAISGQSRLGLGKMRHVQIRYMFLQNLVREGVIG